MTSRRNAPSTRVASWVAAAGSRHRHRVVAEVRQVQVAQQQPAVGVRVGAHPPITAGRERLQLGTQRAVLVEQLLGPVAAQPLFQLRAVLGILVRLRPAAPGGSARCPQPACRPPPSARSSPWACAARSSATPAARPVLAVAGRALNGRDVVERVVEGGGQLLVHGSRIVSGDAVIGR